MSRTKTFPVFTTHLHGSACGHQHDDEVRANNCALNRSRSHGNAPVQISVRHKNGTSSDFGSVMFNDAAAERLT